MSSLQGLCIQEWIIAKINIILVSFLPSPRGFPRGFFSILRVTKPLSGPTCWLLETEIDIILSPALLHDSQLQSNDPRYHSNSFLT